jgi:hypothetical protein
MAEPFQNILVAPSCAVVKISSFVFICCYQHHNVAVTNFTTLLLPTSQRCCYQHHNIAVTNITTLLLPTSQRCCYQHHNIAVTNITTMAFSVFRIELRRSSIFLLKYRLSKAVPASFFRWRKHLMWSMITGLSKWYTTSGGLFTRRRQQDWPPKVCATLKKI